MKIQSLRVVFLAIVSFLMSTLRTVIITFRMEKNVVANKTYYLSSEIEVTAFAVVSMILVAIFAAWAVSLGRKKRIDLDHSAGSVPAGSLVLSFTLIFASFVYMSTVVAINGGFYTVIGLLIFAFSILSAINYFCTGLFYYSKRSAGLQSFAALAPIFLSVFRLLGDFIRKSAAPFASSGAYHLVALIAVMLFFLLEGKSYVSPTSASLYCFFGYVAIFFLMIYSLPNIVLHCFGMFEFDYYAAYSVVDIGMAYYIATRLSSSQFKDKEDKTA